MVAAISVSCAIIYLLATSKGTNERKSPKRKSFGSARPGTPVSGSGTGRRRYGRSGQKIQNDKFDEGRSTTSKKGTRRTPNKRDNFSRQGKGTQASNLSEMTLYDPLPPLTSASEALPTYFSCRHTYEQTLIDEIQSHVDRVKQNQESSHVKERPFKIESPSPGLVRVDDPNQILSKLYDPVYALQTMPDSVVVSSTSIKGLSKAIYCALLGSDESFAGDTEGNNELDTLSQSRERQRLLRNELRSAPRGSLAIHPLVPGCCKGQRHPVSLSRSQRVAEELSSVLRKGFAAARRLTTKQSTTTDVAEKCDQSNENQKYVLQIMLLQHDLAIASLTKCKHIGPGQNYWPNWHHSLGMANVDITDYSMPSSAYRKLMEALECLRIRPTMEELQPSSSSSSVVIDLGACPGGWTTVFRRYFDCNVVAVDRSELDPRLMMDDMVTFCAGDAFTFVPSEEIAEQSSARSPQLNTFWMVSDVIAYPDRIIELLERWCGGRWATFMIVTMKFQGSKPSLSDLEVAIDTAKAFGYECRAKHFFNNKNEVTLMVHQPSVVGYPPGSTLVPEVKEGATSFSFHHLEDGVLGSSMYPIISPVA